MITTNELFSVVEFSPTVFSKTKPTDLQYRLTLILHKEEESLLFLSSPGFHPSFPNATRDIETIIQVVFSDFLLDLFHTQAFAFIGKFLRESPGNLQFFPEPCMPVKDSIVRLRTDNSFESNMQFLYAMQTLATDCKTMVLDDGWSITAGLQAANKINKVKHYVKENYREQIKRSQVAGIVGLSSSSFSRFFKQHTGLNFSDYLNIVRIKEASRLLQNTDDTILGITYSCGFNSPRYFNDVFRKYKGTTPGEFRGRA